MANSRSNVDFLFGSQSIEEIKVVRQKLESDTVKKSDDLQQLIVDHYLPLLDANDLLQDASKKCVAAMSVLESFDNSWKNVRKSRAPGPISLRSQENEKRVQLASSVICLLNTIRKSWISLENEDFINSTKLLREIDTKFAHLDRTLIPVPLISQISDSIENLYKWSKVSISRVFSNPQSPIDTVKTALVAITMIAEHKNLDETLELFLKTSSLASSCDPRHLTHLCCELVNRISFTTKVVYQAFLDERSETTLSLLMRNTFPSFPCRHVDRQTIVLKYKNWLSDERTLFSDLVAPILNETTQFSDIISALMSVETSLSMVENDWNHYTPLLNSSKLDIWPEFLATKFLPAIEQSIVRLVEDVSLSLDEDLPQMNVDMSSFIWPSVSNEAFDSLEMFELRINGICPHYVSASESTLRYIKSLASQCQDLHPEIAIVGPDDSQRIKNKLVDSLIDHIQRSVDVMKCQVERNELLTPQAINITRNIATRCKPLKSLMELSGDASKWLQVKNLLLDAASGWIETFIGNRVEIEAAKCLKQLQLDEEAINAQASIWEDVTIVGTSEDESQRTATVKVPICTSLALLELMNRICNYVNRYLGHVMPESASRSVLLKLASELTPMYGKIFTSLSQATISSPAKQRQALQFYFDLIFLRIICSTCKDSKMKSIIPQMTTVHRSFETLIDPFDLHLISKNMQSNASQAVKSHVQLLSLILPENCLLSLKRT